MASRVDPGLRWLPKNSGLSLANSRAAPSRIRNGAEGTIQFNRLAGWTPSGPWCGVRGPPGNRSRSSRPRQHVMPCSPKRNAPGSAFRFEGCPEACRALFSLAAISKRNEMPCFAMATGQPSRAALPYTTRPEGTRRTPRCREDPRAGGNTRPRIHGSSLTALARQALGA